MKEGRFGPYVTDGTTNASLRKGDSVEAIDIERASELLAERRAAGPSTRKKKAATKKAPGQEEGLGEEGPDEEEGRRRRRPPATKKAAGSPATDGADPAAMKAPSTEPF